MQFNLFLLEVQSGLSLLCEKVVGITRSIISQTSVIYCYGLIGTDPLDTERAGI